MTAPLNALSVRAYGLDALAQRPTAPQTSPAAPGLTPQARPAEAPLPPPPPPAYDLPPELVQEVQSIAARAGYVGLTETAIARAMSQGTSLLTDVRA